LWLNFSGLKVNKDIKISDFSYNLPNDRIAKYPLKERDKSKMLVWKSGKIEASIFENCVDFLPKNSQLIFNNTRVIHARLFFKKATGAKIEIFCLEPVEPVDYQVAFQQKESVIWKCMVGNSKKWKSETLLRELKIKDKQRPPMITVPEYRKKFKKEPKWVYV
jgi:S-adenosylmethionine:tRNA ribosyltransferase-isomerase